MKFVENWGRLDMKSKECTIALRFADTFAPIEGTILAHRNLISEIGFVWYGKLGTAVSGKVVNKILSNAIPRILLIHSGKLVDIGLTSKRYNMIFRQDMKYRSIIEIMQRYLRLGLRLRKLKKHPREFLEFVQLLLQTDRFQRCQKVV